MLPNLTIDPEWHSLCKCCGQCGAKHGQQGTWTFFPLKTLVIEILMVGLRQVVAFGSSFVQPSSCLSACLLLKIPDLMFHAARIASSKPSSSLQDAISTAERTIDGHFNEHPATLEYLVKDDGSVALTHVIQIQNEDTGTWVEAFVDAHSNTLVSVIDFVTKASVMPIPHHAGLRDLYTYHCTVLRTSCYQGISNPGLRNHH